jgi:hypothetical protein
MLNNLQNTCLLGLIIFTAFLFISCEETDLANKELLELRPGGTITTSLTSSTRGTFRVTNDSFPTYGFYHDQGKFSSNKDYYYFSLSVSGKKNDMLYLFVATGAIGASEMDFLKTNPRTQFVISEAEAEVVFKKGSTLFYTTRNMPTFKIPATMTISNYGNVGDKVTVNFYFHTNVVPGFSDMAGVVKTRYVIYK